MITISNLIMIDSARKLIYYWKKLSYSKVEATPGLLPIIFTTWLQVYTTVPEM